MVVNGLSDSTVQGEGTTPAVNRSGPARTQGLFMEGRHRTNADTCDWGTMGLVKGSFYGTGAGVRHTATSPLLRTISRIQMQNSGCKF